MGDTPLQPPTSKTATLDSDLVETIVQIVKAMRADYGRSFQTQFENDEVLRTFKNRLYSKLKGIPKNLIVAGYEMALAQSPKFVPNIQQIVSCVVQAEKENKRIVKNKIEAARVAALPPPTITCNPIQMLRDAIAFIENDEKDLTKEEKRFMHHSRLRAHEDLIKAHTDKKELVVHNEHKCVASFCEKPGALSHGTTGANNFYCKDHFRQAL